MRKLFCLFVSFLFLFVIQNHFALASEPVDSSDLAIWHLDETSTNTVYDATANLNNLGWNYNIYGNGRIRPDRVAGQWDMALNFNQREESFTKNIWPKADLDKVTIGVWIKTDLISTDYSNFFWAGSYSNTYHTTINSIAFSVKDGLVFLDLKQNGLKTAQVASYLNVNDNNWHFAAASFVANTGSMKLYIDGVLQGETIFTGLIPSIETINLGSRESYYGPISQNFKGAVDDVWIRKEVFSEQKIQDIYNSNKPYKLDISVPAISQLSIKAYYPFDETNGNIALDQSGNGYNLNWGSNPWGGGDPSPRRVAGNFGKAINFKKVEDHFYYNYPTPDYSPDGVSLGVWVKTTDNSAYSQILFLRGNTSNPDNSQNFFGLAQINGKIKAYLSFADGCAITANGPSCFFRSYSTDSQMSVSDNNWHFVVVTFDSRAYNHKVKLYIDGNFESEKFVPGIFPLINTMSIGFRDNYNNPGVYNYSGNIDDLFLLSSVLTSDQVKKIYSNNKPFKWPLEVKNPVLIIPGIMGTRLKNESGDEIWPNLDAMFWPGEDTFLYKLEMDQNGISKNNIVTGDIIRKVAMVDIYDGLIKELTNAGYVEGSELFVLPYDWRQDIAISADVTLKNKIDELKNLTGKVDVVAHSMGGLMFKKYIYDFGPGSIGKYIDIATPHLGAPKAAKALLFGDSMGFNFLFLGANQNTMKNIAQNMPAVYNLLPSQKYFNSQNIDYKNYLYNEEFLFNPLYLPQANMDYTDSNFFLGFTGRNENLLPFNQALHSQIDDLTYGDSYNIVGCGQATIGKIWFKGKDKDGEDKYDTTYINGDGTVPLRSATYFREPISYARAEHGSISGANGVKELVVSILKGEENNFNYNSYSNMSRTESVCSFTGYTVTIHSPLSLNISTSDGRHLGPDADGNIENNIDGASYDILGNNKFAFVPATGEKYIISGQAESAGNFDMRVRKIVDGQYTETVLFYNLPLNSASSAVQAEISESGVFSSLQYDAEGDGVFEKTISPSSVLPAEQQNDVIPPTTAVNIAGEEVSSSTYMLLVNFNFTANDGGGSGVLDTYYQIDGKGWQKYSESFDYNIQGNHKLEYYSVDKSGNEEETRTVNFIIIGPTAGYLINKINNLYSHGEIYNVIVKDYFNYQLNLVIGKQKEMSAAIASWRSKLAVESAKCTQSKYPALCQSVIKGIEAIINSIESAGNSFIKYRYAEMLKTLDIYKTKNWLSQSAYDIIKIRLIYLRDK